MPLSATHPSTSASMPSSSTHHNTNTASNNTHDDGIRLISHHLYDDDVNILAMLPSSLVSKAIEKNHRYWFGEHNTPQITDAHIAVLKQASEYAYNIWVSKREVCEAFLNSYPLTQTLTAQKISDLIDDYTLDEFLNRADEAEVMQGLRHLRQLLMVRWIWQDALSIISLEKLTKELSDFADSTLNFAKNYVWAQLVKRYGTPRYHKDELVSIIDKPSAMSKQLDNAENVLNTLAHVEDDGIGKKMLVDDMAIFAMGKLGAGELNLSSDIDLVFVHCTRGETDGNKAQGTKSIDNKRFMTRLGQGIIKLLDTTTADGFVFRVDMRLRPWGEGSDLAIHLSALEKYFANHGRAWERFAWLKARIVNPISDEFELALNSLVKPFVFRYYVDYSTFAALREMKLLIQNQVMQREDLDNVKLGAGGIRDIEFVVQAFQLIYGGRHRELEVKSNLRAMQTLNDLGFMDNKVYEQLEQAYRFFRRTEHGIQAIADQQTQKLPSDTKWQHNLAKTLGFEDWAMFMQVLNAHRNNVHVPFDRMVTERQTSTCSDDSAYTHAVEKLKTILSDDNNERLEQFLGSKVVSNLSEEAKQRLDDAMPILAHALIEHEAKQGLANVALPRLITLLEAISRRSIYLVMLSENPDATIGLIPMLSASPWIASELARYPVLLDSFLQQRYRHLPDKAELEDILRQRLLRVEPDDEETLLSVLRLFKNNQVLAVAASDVLAERPIMKVSDSLTMIAEVVLKATLERAFASVVARHGYPISNQGQSVSEARNGFAVIGYGKLGGYEMSYTSDLDLVFIHQIDEQASTTGDNPISGMKFSAKLARKLMNYLNTHTRDGRAYEIDMRLRPSGNAGMMVVSSQSFERYQMEKAWVWEHQALVRARSICGDDRVMHAFEDIRKQVLSKPRDIEELKQEVTKMRVKMQDNLGTSKRSQQAGKFHLKQDFGGLVDIEFMAQFCVLAYVHDYPQLAKWSDNVNIFETISHIGLWNKKDCAALTKSYLKIRAAMHQLALANEDVVVEEKLWHDTRMFIQAQWQAMIGDR